MDARKSGSFKIGGDIEVHRLGFGAMRITGPCIWGPPLDRSEAIRTLKRLPELGIDFVDTADSYGPDISEQLITQGVIPLLRDSHRNQSWIDTTRSRRTGDPRAFASASDQESRATWARTNRTMAAAQHRS